MGRKRGKERLKKEKKVRAADSYAAQKSTVGPVRGNSLDRGQGEICLKRRNPAAFSPKVMRIYGEQTDDKQEALTRLIGPVGARTTTRRTTHGLVLKKKALPGQLGDRRKKL